MDGDSSSGRLESADAGVLAAFAAGALPIAFVSLARMDPAPPAELHWFKGNTHTHTLESDGDSTPEEVTRWYKEHGYNFLVLSDHNVLTR